MIALEFKDYSQLLRPPWLSPVWDPSLIFKCQPLFLLLRKLTHIKYPAKSGFLSKDSHTVFCDNIYELRFSSTLPKSLKKTFLTIYTCCFAKQRSLRPLNYLPKDVLETWFGLFNVAELINVAGCHF